MISGHGNIETAVQAIKKGAFDFIEKPLDLNRILVTIRNAKDKTVLIEEKKVLKKTVRKFKGSAIIGETDAILDSIFAFKECHSSRFETGKLLVFLSSS